MSVSANPQRDPARTEAPPFALWWNAMFRENAMTEEAMRHMRRFFLPGGQTRAGNLVTLGLIVLFYLWFLSMIIRHKMAVAMPLQYLALVAVTLLAPFTMYAAISGEREKGTWDALVLTRLTPAQIIVGKLAWRIGLVVLVMAVIGLLTLVALVFGVEPVSNGLTWGALAAAQAMIFGWGVLLCAFSLWVSAHTRQGVASITAILSTLLGALVGVPVLFGMFGFDPGSTAADTVPNMFGAAILWASPFTCLYTVTGLETSPGDTPLLPPVSWAWLMAGLFLLAAALFVWSTHVRLRRLEEPVAVNATRSR